MNSICKAFGRVEADRDVDFDLLPGEIHGLLGENGAGKSTLMNILYGLHEPDSGEIIVRGKPQILHSPHDAIALGIGMVHQHFMLVPTLSVIDNVILGLQQNKGLVLDRDAARKRLLDFSERYGLHVDPDAKIWQLSIGDRQRVEILKALYREVEVLILDEPTSVLTPQETKELFTTIRKLVDRGLSVIFITHNLEEALAITDRVTVLRDAEVIDTLPTASTSKNKLARLMVGREVLFRLKREPYEENARHEVLQVSDLVVAGDRGTMAVQGVSFSVNSGEIVGIAGVDGNGQSELVHALSGLRPVERGTFSINGREMQNASPRRILQNGMGHIPENLEEALVGDFTLVENLMLNRHYTPEFSRMGILDEEQMNGASLRLIREYNIRTSGEKARANTLSGGNKQKLVVARELSRDPELLIAAHPTKGIDIGAEEDIRNLLLERRHEGTAILLISTKLDEILSLSDRILVMEGGRIMGETTRDEADIEKIGLLMAGIKDQE